MFPFSDTASRHIRYLLGSLNETNSDHIYQALREYIGYGTEGSILVLQSCFHQLDIYGKDLKNMKLEPIFASIFKFILDKPNFSTVLCESVRSTAVSEDLLENLCTALQLSAPEKIGIGLALSDSENHDIRMCGKNFLMAQIAEVCANYASVDSAEQIQNILMFLNRSEGLCKHVDSFMQMLSVVQLKEDFEFILAPLLSDELRDINFLRNLEFNESSENDFDTILAEMEKEMSLAGLMKELGYGCTVNVSQCKEMLSLFLPLTEITVARILGTIVRTNDGLEDSQNTYSTFCSALGSSSLSDRPVFDSWNIDVLIDTIKQLAPGINWINVFENLDHEGFYIPNEAAFSLFMSIFSKACQDPFPLRAVCGSVWKNAEGQLSFLKYAVLVPPEVFSFAHSGRQLAYVDAVSVHKFQPGHANHAWLCVDLLEVLCQLAERGNASSVRPMLEYPLKHCPEVLLLGMANVNTAYNLLQYEVSSIVFPLALKNATGNSLALHLWHVNPNILLRGFLDARNMDPDNTSRVLDFCLELKILSPVLEMIPSSFGIRLAALASRKELLDLEKWLSTNLNTYKDALFEECVKFVKEVQFSARDMPATCFHQSGSLWNLYLETISTFLKVLQAHTRLISSGNLSEEIKKLTVTFMHGNIRVKSDVGTDLSTSNGYADNIEIEANSYFHQMFSGLLAVDSVIQMLARFKESSEKREQLIYECMIANLFEEYKFFSKYPERQLKIAAVLFGSLIKHQLVTHLTLGIALRVVLDALRKPADSKMFSFGTKALEQFVDRLIEWPQYCNHISQISHLRGTHSELVAFIERALTRISSGTPELDVGHVTAADQLHGSIPAAHVEMPGSSFLSIGSSSAQAAPQVSSPVQLQHRQQNSIEEQHKASFPLPNYMKPVLFSAGQLSALPSSDTPSTQKSNSTANASAALSSSPGFVCPSRTATSARFGSVLNIETLVAAAERKETPLEAPASQIQDKISFIINNLSLANVEAKAKEFSELLKVQFYPWFAQYMVMKRTSIEPNFHDLYLKFLNKVNSKPLNKEIMQATYENCKVLLGSELIKSSSEERSLLKNLGSWLGKITIGRNQVLRAREIDPKSLIIEAYEKGLMIAVIPFTSKILESCHKSLAYQPPNPWTMGILGLLTEIYALPNLKMNLKFEIEVLFKHLVVDMKDVTPTCLLKDRVREVEGNPDFSNKDVASSQPQIVNEIKSGIASTRNQVELTIDIASPSHPTGQSRILSQYVAPLDLSSAMSMEDEKLAALGLSDQPPSAQGLLQGQSPFSVSQLRAPASNIEQVVVNPTLHGLNLHMHFQSVLPIAMDRAIKERISNIVQRSVSIATQTTKELVLKDYAMESDETRIYNAAHLMVASLAGSLAHVTCKEPLRGSITSQLRNSLQGLNIASEFLDKAIQLVTNDNLDMGCALIEQAATEKAIQTIDGEIAQQLSIRRKQREGIGPAFFDASMYTQGRLGVLLEALRPKPGISHSLQRVYEDFVRLPWQNQSSQNSNAVAVGPSTTVICALSQGYGIASGAHNPGIYSSGIGNTGMCAFAYSFDLGPKEFDSGSAKQLSVSSVSAGMADGVVQQNFENDVVIASLPSATPSELQSAEPNAVKESGASAQSSSSTSVTERLGSNISEPSLTPGDALDKYLLVSKKLETLVTNGTVEAEIQEIIVEVPGIILRCLSRDEAALAVAQKVFKGLYANASSNVHVGAHLAILSAIRDVSKLVVKELTSWVIYSDEDRKFNTDITVGLIRSELLNLAEYNVHMAKLLDAGRNKAATEFAISLIQALVINNSKVISELHHLVDALAKLAAKPGSPESLQQLVEIARYPAANAAALSSLTVGKDDNTRQSKDQKATGHFAASWGEFNVLDSVEPDPVGFREQVIYSDEDRKFNTDITVGLIRSELLNLAEYNVHMAKLLDAGRNKAATEFAISLIQALVINNSKVISELHHLVDALAKLAAKPGSPESLQQLVEIARYPAANAAALSSLTVGKDDNTRQSKDQKATGHFAASWGEFNVLDSVEPDPVGFREQVSMLFAGWYRICELPGENDSARAHFVFQLLQSGLLKGDDMSDRFFCHLMELSVSHCLSSEVTSPQTQPLLFLAIDIYATLVFSILKFYPVDRGSNKLSLLSKVIAVTMRFIQKDSEEKRTSFNPRPYFRLFVNWLLDLTTLEPVSDGANFQVLTALANAFHALQPLKVPAFSFAWLELVSHRSFMPKLLSGNPQKGWPFFQCLLVDLFQFLEPFLRNAELGEAVHFLYKGTLRVLLVLLHDFPEFLCDYHFSFCDVIPPSCIQMRNIILSAFPRNMRLPDPSTPNLKIDLMAEISQSPHILSEVDAAVKAKQIKGDVDEYLKTRQQESSFLAELKQKLLLPPNDAARAGTRYNAPLINSLVLYVGMQAIQQLQARTPHAQPGVPLAVYFVGAALDIFQTLMMDLDIEGRYLFLNAVANQLRYPNNHTHYFSFILLYLFAESNQEVIQEQITRVLLERLIVNQPHPWGLLITFIELIKNPRYNFWSRSFTRCAPEIEKLFESVSRSCGGPNPLEEGLVSGRDI